MTLSYKELLTTTAHRDRALELKQRCIRAGMEWINTLSFMLVSHSPKHKHWSFRWYRQYLLFILPHCFSKYTS